MSIIEKLNWRYATKKFSADKKLSDAKVHTLLESLRLSASSYGLEPWKFIVVENPEIREKLVEHSYNQYSPVVEASHFVVLCRQATMEEADLDAFVERMASAKGLEVEALDGLSKMLKGSVLNLPEDKRYAWLDRQVYIALGNLLTVSALEDVDTLPMEGFVPAGYSEVLGLEEKGLVPLVAVALGYRCDEDKYQHSPKMRYSKEEVIMTI